MLDRPIAVELDREAPGLGADGNHGPRPVCCRPRGHVALERQENLRADLPSARGDAPCLPARRTGWVVGRARDCLGDRARRPAATVRGPSFAEIGGDRARAFLRRLKEFEFVFVTDVGGSRGRQHGRLHFLEGEPGPVPTRRCLRKWPRRHHGRAVMLNLDLTCPS